MKTALLAVVLLAPALLATSARAANADSVTKVEKYLRDDEKALLAAILTHPDLSAQFDAEAPLALSDPKNLAPFLGVWRGKVEAFAETDGARPTPDLEGHYANYAQLMTPEQRAYMIRRLGTMKEDDRNSLIGYLGSVNDALAKNGQLTWYTKKVVAGIMDQYRKDLTSYVATPMAQTAKRDAASSATAFAAIQKADADSRLAAAKPVVVPSTDVADAPVVKPPVKPVPKPKPVVKQPATPPVVAPNAGSVVTKKPAGGALDQARDAAQAGGNGGVVFDGGGAAGQPTGGSAVVVPAGSGSAHPTLSPSGKPGSEAGLAGSIPAVPPSPEEASFEASIKKMQTKPAPQPKIKLYAAIAGGVLGGLLGGLIGFLVGGPVGMLIGAGIGIAGGAAAGHLIANKLFQ